MGEVVNLRRARKARARDAAAKAADTARLQHGRTPQERRTAQAEAERQAHLLEQHRLGSDPAAPIGDPDTGSAGTSDVRDGD